jgi:hypothetical protein
VARSRRKSDDETTYTGTARWWQLSGESIAGALWSWVDRLKNHTRRRAALDAVWDAIYEDEPIGTGLDTSPAGAIARAQKARLNLAQSMVDTCAARIAKRRPMPVISADDARGSRKLFAKRSSRVLRRKMGHSKVERLCPAVVFAGLVRGTGVAQVYRDGGDVAIEAIPRREVVYDPSEARYGSPRTLARVMRVGRDELAAEFPKHAERIKMLSTASREEWEPWTEDAETDQVDAVVAWRLPTSPGAEDGRVAICARGLVLHEAVWTRTRFPLAFFHWSPPLTGAGFFGSGLVKAVASTQQEINEIIGGMAEGINLAQALKVFVQRGSNVDKNHLRAKNPAVIEHDGQAPQFVAPTPFSMAVLEYCKWRIQQAYEIAGVSQASAASKNPLGSNASGKALDTMYDLESDRFSHIEAQYAAFRVELGQCMLDCAQDIAADKDTKPSEKAAWITATDWAECCVDEGDYQLILEPVNFLPEARAGRLSTVKELADAGLLGTDPSTTASLFDEPDLAAANRYLLGLHRKLERWIENLTDTDVELEDCMPEPSMLRVPNKARDMLLGEMDNLEAEEETDEVISRFRWAVEMLKAIEDQTAAPMAPAPGAAPPMPAPVDPMATAGAMPAAPMPMLPDPMGGLTSQLAAGMPLPQGVMP